MTGSGKSLGICPERPERRYNWLDRLAVSMAGAFASFVHPRPGGFEWIVGACGEQEASVRRLNDAELKAAALEVGWNLRRHGRRNDLVARSFALVREAARRRLDLRHFDVQLVGGLVLLSGHMAEMDTGEGKTLTATLAACTAALAGEPVHIVTVNDYLAERDSQWMGPVYESLGLTVGTIIHGLPPAERKAAYHCDVTYCTNKELAFDYLKDRMVLWDRPGEASLQLERLYGGDSRSNRIMMRGLHFAIVDEADSVLIDEARTPLIISSGTEMTMEQTLYLEAFDFASGLREPDDFLVISDERAVELTAAGKDRIGEHKWSERNMWATGEQREEIVRQALVSLHIFERDKQYLVTDGKVKIIDEYTGRVMADRSWERGLQQLIEIKEGVEMTSRKDTRARISYQRFFRRYLRIAGMTGTAREVSNELWTIYRLRVVSVPPNRPVRRSYNPEMVYATEEGKWEAVVGKIEEEYRKNTPVLVGSRSVAASEHLSGLLTQRSIPHRVLNARQDRQEAEIVAQAGEPGRITVATNMAGRGTDIKLAPGVAELGGLHVIATEFHESHRIDRQLFGRAGRQGDPGTCQAIVSLEDELIHVHGYSVVKRLAGLLPKSPEGLVQAKIGKILFLLAQGAAERVNRKARRNLLKLDEHLGDALAFSGRQE